MKINKRIFNQYFSLINDVSKFFSKKFLFYFILFIEIKIIILQPNKNYLNYIRV